MPQPGRSFPPRLTLRGTPRAADWTPPAYDPGVSGFPYQEQPGQERSTYAVWLEGNYGTQGEFVQVPVYVQDSIAQRAVSWPDPSGQQDRGIQPVWFTPQESHAPPEPSYVFGVDPSLLGDLWYDQSHQQARSTYPRWYAPDAEAPAPAGRVLEAPSNLQLTGGELGCWLTWTDPPNMQAGDVIAIIVSGVAAVLQNGDYLYPPTGLEVAQGVQRVWVNKATMTSSTMYARVEGLDEHYRPGAPSLIASAVWEPWREKDVGVEQLPPARWTPWVEESFELAAFYGIPTGVPWVPSDEAPTPAAAPPLWYEEEQREPLRTIDAVSGLAAAGHSAPDITLTWTDPANLPVGDNTHYQVLVYRSSSPGVAIEPFGEYASVNAGAQTLVDTAVSVGQTWYYRVVPASYPSGSAGSVMLGAPSPEVSALVPAAGFDPATFPYADEHQQDRSTQQRWYDPLADTPSTLRRTPQAPTNVQLTTAPDGRFTLTWTDPPGLVGSDIVEIFIGGDAGLTTDGPEFWYAQGSGGAYRYAYVNKGVQKFSDYWSAGYIGYYFRVAAAAWESPGGTVRGEPSQGLVPYPPVQPLSVAYQPDLSGQQDRSTYPCWYDPSVEPPIVPFWPLTPGSATYDLAGGLYAHPKVTITWPSGMGPTDGAEVWTRLRRDDGTSDSTWASRTTAWPLDYTNPGTSVVDLGGAFDVDRPWVELAVFFFRGNQQAAWGIGAAGTEPAIAVANDAVVPGWTAGGGANPGYIGSYAVFHLDEQFPATQPTTDEWSQRSTQPRWYQPDADAVDFIYSARIVTKLYLRPELGWRWGTGDNQSYKYASVNKGSGLATDDAVFSGPATVQAIDDANGQNITWWTGTLHLSAPWGTRDFGTMWAQLWLQSDDAAVQDFTPMIHLIIGHSEAEGGGTSNVTPVRFTYQKVVVGSRVRFRFLFDTTGPALGGATLHDGDQLGVRVVFYSPVAEGSVTSHLILGYGGTTDDADGDSWVGLPFAATEDPVPWVAGYPWQEQPAHEQRSTQPRWYQPDADVTNPTFLRLGQRGAITNAASLGGGSFRLSITDPTGYTLGPPYDDYLALWWSFDGGATWEEATSFLTLPTAGGTIDVSNAGHNDVWWAVRLMAYTGDAAPAGENGYVQGEFSNAWQTSYAYINDAQKAAVATQPDLNVVESGGTQARWVDDSHWTEGRNAALPNRPTAITTYTVPAQTPLSFRVSWTPTSGSWDPQTIGVNLLRQDGSMGNSQSGSWVAGYSGVFLNDQSAPNTFEWPDGSYRMWVRTTEASGGWWDWGVWLGLESVAKWTPYALSDPQDATWRSNQPVWVAESHWTEGRDPGLPKMIVSVTNGMPDSGGVALKDRLTWGFSTGGWDPAFTRLCRRQADGTFNWGLNLTIVYPFTTADFPVNGPAGDWPNIYEAGTSRFVYAIRIIEPGGGGWWDAGQWTTNTQLGIDWTPELVSDPQDGWWRSTYPRWYDASLEPAPPIDWRTQAPVDAQAPLWQEQPGQELSLYPVWYHPGHEPQEGTALIPWLYWLVGGPVIIQGGGSAILIDDNGDVYLSLGGPFISKAT